MAFRPDDGLRRGTSAFLSFLILRTDEISKQTMINCQVVDEAAWKVEMSRNLIRTCITKMLAKVVCRFPSCFSYADFACCTAHTVDDISKDA